MNRAVLLAGRPRHHGHASQQYVFAVELEISMASAEESREQPAEPLVRLFEHLLEPGSRLAIDPANCVLECLERFGEVRVLRVEIRLALGLLFELVDRREVDRAEAL